MAEIHSETWLEIGRIIAPQGLNGELRVYPDTDFPERFLEPGDRWLLKTGQAEPELVRLLSGRDLPGKGLYVIKLQGVNYRDQAEALRNAKLLVPVSDRLELEPDEYHVADLVGLEVRLQETGQAIGTVVDIYSAGNDLLAVQLFSKDAAIVGEHTQATPQPDPAQKSASPILVPFVHEIVPIVELSAGYVEITPPKGLLPEA
jgi:16S rRNA processing protein RimM